MPSLKQLVCSVEWSGSGIPLPEYNTSYGDGRTETYIPIPELPTPFAIRLRSSGWIAFGLAMFVYIDGEYQCNRNRCNLKILDGSFPAQQAQVEFVVRQKEVYSNDGTFFGSNWKFEKLNLVSGTPGQLAHPAPFDGEYIGTIEVVVLRCHPSVKNSLLGNAVGNSALAPAETYTSVGEQEENARPRKGTRLRNGSAAPQKNQPLPSADAVGGFSGLLDGPNDYHDPGNRGVSYGGDGSWDEQVGVPDETPNKGSQEWHTVKTGPRTGIYQPKGWPSPVQQQQIAYGSTGSTGGGWMQPQGQPYGTPGPQLTPIIPGTPAVVINVAQPTPQPAGWGGNLTSNAPSVADSWATRKTVYEANENNIETSQHQNSVGSGWPGSMAYSHRRAGSSRTSSVRPSQSTLGPSNQGPRNSPRVDNFQPTGNTTGGDGWGNGSNHIQGVGWSNDANENRGSSHQNHASNSWDNNNTQNQGASKWNSNTNQNEGDSSWNNNTDQNQGPSTYWNNKNQNQGGSSWDTNNNNNKTKGGGNWENNTGNNQGGGNTRNDQIHDSSWGNNSYQNQDDNQNGNFQTAEQHHSWNTEPWNTEPSNISNEPNNFEQSGMNQPASSENNNANSQTQGASTPSGDRVNENNRPAVWGTNPQQGFGTNIAPPSNSRFRGSKLNSPHPSHQRGNSTYTRPPAPIATSSAPAQGVWSSPPLPPQTSPCQPFVGPRIPTTLSRTTAAMPSRLVYDSSPTAYVKPYWIGSQQDAVREGRLIAPKSIIQRSEPGEPLYTISEEAAQRKKVSHQVQIGKPMAYTHKRMTPRYMDAHENPYAIFVFKYRSQALLQERFDIIVVEPEIDEKKRLQDLPKDELIEHVLKMKTSSAKSSSPAPAAWPASPQHSVLGFGPSGLSNHDQGTTGIGIDMGQLSSKLNQLQVSSNQGQNQTSPNPEHLWGRDTNQSALGQSHPANTGVAWVGNGGSGAPQSSNSQSGNAAIANTNRGGESQNSNGAASGNNGGTGWGGDTGPNSGLNGNCQSGGYPNSGGGGAFHRNITNSGQGNGNESVAGNQDSQQW